MNIYICVFYLKKKENSSQSKKIILIRNQSFWVTNDSDAQYTLLEYRNKRKKSER